MRIDLPVCGLKECRYSFDCNCTADKIQYERCEYRQYKDTGLEPEEIADLMVVNGEKAEILGALELENLDHIRDLLDAERDGRCVVLPCRVDDTVWVINNSKCIDELTVKYIQSAPDGTFCFQAECRQETEDCYCGQDSVCAMRFSAGNMREREVFLTLEEAEAALREGQNE